MRSLPAVVSASLVLAVAVVSQELPTKPADLARAGFVRLTNGKDLAGWHAQRQVDPVKFAALPDAERQKQLAEDAASSAGHWRVAGEELVNDGEGAFLTTDENFGDAEFVLEYRTVAKADSGIYLRGCPQVQIWDFTEAGGKWSLGADKGSGGLWNNQVHERFPPALADRPFGEWNRLEIRQLGSLVWVRLNGKVTVDGVVMENYFDRDRPLPASGPVQLQTHGGEIRFRELWARRIAGDEANALLAAHRAEGFASIWDGKTFAGLQGDTDSYEIVDGAIRCKAGKGGNLFTKDRYSDFSVRLEFQVPPGGNNGLAIRYPGEGDPAYTGFEVQVLDDSAEQYANLKPYQYHGSVYGVVPSHRGYQRPVGQWNFEEVTVRGSHVTVMLNGTPIVDADIKDLPTHLGENHIGKDRREGFFGFCGHNDPVMFRNLSIRRLDTGK